MKNAKILRNQGLIFLHVSGLAGKRAAAGIEDDCLIGNFERELEVLLDQHDG